MFSTVRRCLVLLSMFSTVRDTISTPKDIISILWDIVSTVDTINNLGVCSALCGDIISILEGVQHYGGIPSVLCGDIISTVDTISTMESVQHRGEGGLFSKC